MKGYTLAGVVLLAGCSPALTMHAPRDIQMPDNVVYSCSEGAGVVATYGTQPDGTRSVVLNLDGNDFTLLWQEVPTGTRWAWPSDGSFYVWQSDEAESTYALLWHDGESGSEAPLSTGCTWTGQPPFA